MANAGVALVIDAGQGLGSAVTHRFAKAGMTVVVSTPTQKAMDDLVGKINRNGGASIGYVADATDEDAVIALFNQVERDLGSLEVVVYNANTFTRSPVIETSTEMFKSCWKLSCFGGFLVAREAARHMLPRKQGTILITGATPTLSGSANFGNLAVGRFGLRALAQSMARELGPEGIHVAHVIINDFTAAENREQNPQNSDDLLHPEAIAQTYFELHAQHRSAWTFEIDLRPWIEPF